MRYLVFILLILLSCFNSPVANGQDLNEEKISLGLSGNSLESAFKEIERISNFRFAYKASELDSYTNLYLPLANRSVAETLNLLLASTSLAYKQNRNYILIEKKVIISKTYSLSGSIKNEKGENLAWATIFLSRSKKVTTANEKGEFWLDQLHPGTYELVVKMLGFSSFSREVVIQQESLSGINIVLTENPSLLDEVVVKPNPNRKKQIETFSKFFIGQSANARKSKILNPEVLRISFDEEKQTLEASSDEFLIIENQELGYKIEYLLNKFRLDNRNNIISYVGSPYFEELKGSRYRQKVWEHNRKIAFEGSAMHFFRSVFTNTATAEGFLLYSCPGNMVNISPGMPLRSEYIYGAMNVKPLDPDSVFITVDYDFKTIKLAPARTIHQLAEGSGLFLIYTREKETPDFVRSAHRVPFPLALPYRQPQVSVIHSISENILIDRNGGFSLASFLFNGYWSWEGVGDLLPFDYNNVN